MKTPTVATPAHAAGVRVGDVDLGALIGVAVSSIFITTPGISWVYSTGLVDKVCDNQTV